MISPEHPAKKVWDIWVALLTIFAAVEIPLRIAFTLPPSTVSLGTELLLSACFALDLVLRFFTIVEDHDRQIRDRREVARRYLRTWFLPDLLASIPVSLLAPGGGLGLNWFLRLGRLLALNRLMKLVLIAGWLRRLQAHVMFNPGLARLGVFFFWMTLFAHWTACGWVFIGGQQAAETVGLTYLNALYWTITTLSTVGYGDITPDAPFPKIYTMLVMLAGVGSYGYLIGNVAGILENMDAVRRARASKLDQVNSFLKYRAIPVELRRRVHRYYDHLWEGEFDHDEARLLGDLPINLRTDIALFMHRRLIERVPFFRDATDAFIRDVVVLLKPQLFTPGMRFIEEGAVGDRMYFISHGEVEIVSKDGSVVYETLDDGDFVGEMALLLDRPRTATVRTRGYCDVYILEKEDFLRVLDRHPDFKSHIDRTIRRRLRQIEARGD